MTASITTKDSAKKNHMETPDRAFDWADRRWGPLTLDVAADDWNAKTRDYYDKKRNGLLLPWPGGVWCNPGWEDIYPWVQKALFEFYAGRAGCVVMLLPTRTGTEWYMDFAPRFQITKIRGRLKFGAKPGTTQGKGGFEYCAYFVLEHPPEARYLNATT